MFNMAAAHRGVDFGDIDNYGRIDAVTMALQGSAQYFRNISQNGKHWILLKLIGVKSNRMGLVRRRGASHDRSRHAIQPRHDQRRVCVFERSARAFRPGQSKTVKEIEIVWPSGIRQTLHNVAAGRIVTVTENADR
jgi:hypothetical protein